MRNFRFRLKETKGASLVIAMVFMLFCVFVGGSVLTAATVNGYRLKNLTKVQQQMKLNEESSALYIADGLRRNKDDLKLTITERTIRKQPVTIDIDGTVSTKGAPLDPEHIVDIKVSWGNIPGGYRMTVPQRILLESAVRKYLIGNSLAPDKVAIHNFTWDDPNPDNTGIINSIGSFWVPEQAGTPFTYSFTITSPDLFPDKDYKINFICNSEFDIKVSMEIPDKDGNPVRSSMAVKMSASKSEKKLSPETEIVEKNTMVNEKLKEGTKITTTQRTTTLSWSNPKIVKEGE